MAVSASKPSKETWGMLYRINRSRTVNRYQLNETRQAGERSVTTIECKSYPFMLLASCEPE